MEATFVTIRDYEQGCGHADEMALGVSDIPDMASSRTDLLGWNPASLEPDGGSPA